MFNWLKATFYQTLHMLSFTDETGDHATSMRMGPNRSAGFPTCGSFELSHAIGHTATSRLESQRYGRLENLRYELGHNPIDGAMSSAWVNTISNFIVLAIILFGAVFAHASSKPVVASKGMVVAQERIAAQVGCRVLREGGNAVDAAVATAFALAVTHPAAGNIGGGGFLLYRGSNGETVAYDFRFARLASGFTLIELLIVITIIARHKCSRTAESCRHRYCPASRHTRG
jgi:prepilin-type N-terminal cleavage/methylation domain-containing protein